MVTRLEKRNTLLNFQNDSLKSFQIFARNPKQAEKNITQIQNQISWVQSVIKAMNSELVKVNRVRDRIIRANFLSSDDLYISRSVEEGILFIDYIGSSNYLYKYIYEQIKVVCKNTDDMEIAKLEKIESLSPLDVVVYYLQYLEDITKQNQQTIDYWNEETE